ncbi:Kinase [Hexamita inflata]|uniref:CAMK CAMKL n=1 Tax=Hexamita inflata TaxID=28002 RepID=A0AA86R7V8_9EUKA|nr:CAMK CAMKL [Hexamita inflata]
MAQSPFQNQNRMQQVTPIQQPLQNYSSPFQKPIQGIVVKNYTICKLLGTGAFAQVYQAKHDFTGINVAIKVISKRKIKESDMMHKVQREISIMNSFDHPHVIKLYETIEDEVNIYLIIELAENGEILNNIPRKRALDESKTRYYFQQFIAALHYLHKQANISHRDLKLENTLVNKYDNIKISDFGLSSGLLEGDFLKTSCGTPNYAAPEVIMNQQYLGGPADIWSAGCVLFVLCAGELPFNERDLAVLFSKIRRCEYSIPSHVSRSAADLIKNMLQVNVDKRFTLDQIINHPWFQKDLSKNLKQQFQKGYETRYGLIDEQSILTKVNECMQSNYSMSTLKELLLSQRTKHPACVTFRMLYDQEYEQLIQLMQEEETFSTPKSLKLNSERTFTPIENPDFKNASYDTFSVNQNPNNFLIIDDPAKYDYTVGVKLGRIECKKPGDVMRYILSNFSAKYEWKFGVMTAYKYFDFNLQKDVVTLQMDDSYTKNPFTFCIKIKNPVNFIQHELIIGCCLYVQTDIKRVQNYVLDLRKITGEVSMFLNETMEIENALKNAF